MQSRAFTVLLLVILVSCGSSIKNYTLEWSPSGVATVNSELHVNIGDQLILLCTPGSWSNVLELETPEELMNCNSTFATQTRGTCFGRPIHRLVFNIEEASEVLPGDFSFVRGKPVYLTSFSTGQDITSALTDLTAGGECLTGVKLTLYVGGASSADTISTTTSAGAVSDTGVEDSTEKSLSLIEATEPGDEDPDPDLGSLIPQGLMQVGSVDGSVRLHATPTLVVLLCTLLILILRICS